MSNIRSKLSSLRQNLEAFLSAAEKDEDRLAERLANISLDTLVSLEDEVERGDGLESTVQNLRWRLEQAQREVLEVRTWRDRLQEEVYKLEREKVRTLFPHDLPEIVVQHLKYGEKINAIKELRLATNAGLKVSKEVVEEYCDQNPTVFGSENRPTLAEVMLPPKKQDDGVPF